MARRGRKRKVDAKRVNGRIVKADRAPERVGPTPEMERKKRAVDGMELSDPITYLPFELGLCSALEKFRRSKRACGFGPGSLVACVDDTGRCRADEELADADALLRRGRYEAAANTLLADTLSGYHAVQSFSQHWGEPWDGDLLALEKGARSLAEHYHEHLEEKSQHVA